MIAAGRSIPALDFAVEGVSAAAHAAAPTLVFDVRIAAAGRAVRSLSLNAQLRIDAGRRSYDEQTQARLVEIFGEPERWPTTMRSLLWTHVSLVVTAFDGETVAKVAVPCTYDFDVAAAKYLDALRDGDVPVELLFSGTLFYADEDDRLRAEPVPWDREAAYRMPVRVWREAVEAAFPGTAWIRVGRDCFDRLHAYKATRALPSWDAAIEELLEKGDG